MLLLVTAGTRVMADRSRCWCVLIVSCAVLVASRRRSLVVAAELATRRLLQVNVIIQRVEVK